MNIDFNKLITLLLPTFLRTGLSSLISTIAAQFTTLYTDFQLWQIDIRLQSAMTCQVIYLEMILNYRLLGSFLRTIYISDGDGVIVDFIINVPAGVEVDNYRMIALIEKYKIAGKRYTIGQSAYNYEVQWSDFVCELGIKLNNSVSINYNENSYIWVTTPMPVTSEINVSVLVNGKFVELYTIPVGDTSSEYHLHMAWFPISSIVIISILPVEDANYRYDDNYSWINNGYQHATTLTIKVKLNDVTESTSIFPLMESFTYNGVPYSAITDVQIQQLNDDDYIDRATAYAAYIEENYQSQYPGLMVSETGSRVYNTSSCPLP